MDKLDFSKPEQLQTRDGQQVRIYAIDGKEPYRIHGAILVEGSWQITKWNTAGRSIDDTVPSIYDLIRKPARIKGWVNVYSGSGKVLGYVRPDKGECKKNAGIDCIGQIYIDEEVQT